MLETVYNNFGFLGSLVVSLGIFFFFIFWMAGVAGICKEHEGQKGTIARLFFGILIPVYPVFWLIAEMISQKRQLNKL
ncbi:hypothetical protein DYD21_06165 [Rhodohalobacter sp. SW132]|uniref:hypothetical protein n=1 Tax=Rhodohalobacter sp. SW132 TaxID=2293433 RepID=UPI000E2210B0|nr:hypothetical protein [Rhodohalobacter sp. SW132]REL38191.1 hypothetical protein DYD21_06165 [Rhodohalobacter sp. SW132]